MNILEICKDIYCKNAYALEHFPVKDKSRFAVICPGGGYGMVCSFVCGRPFAKKLNEMGYSAFVLKYRVRKKARFPNPMDDLARAVAYILSNAEALNVEKDGYSVWGASAGGHLAASFGTDNVGYKKYDLPKPAALILTYPVITMSADGHRGSRDNLLGKRPTAAMIEETSVEKHLWSGYPPTFLWCSKTDKVVPPVNSIMLSEGLNALNVPNELLLFEDGKHGSGLSEDTEVEIWFEKAVVFWEKNSWL